MLEPHPAWGLTPPHAPEVYFTVPDFRFVHLPVELMLDIIERLPDEDIRTISLVSSQLRTLMLPLVFRHIKFTDHSVKDWVDSAPEIARISVRSVSRH